MAPSGTPLDPPAQARLADAPPPPDQPRRRVSRRTALLGAAAGLVTAGTAGALTRDQRAPSSLPAATLAVATVADPTPPDTTLMNEHGVLIRLLLVYNEAVARLDEDRTVAVAGLHAAAELVHDVIENFHEALEEGYVFPVVRAAGGYDATVDTLLLQHARGRFVTQMLLADVTTATLASSSARQRVSAAARAFVRMYEPHEAREDTVIFPAYRSNRTAQQLQDDAETFTQLQDEAFGNQALATVVGWVAAIERPLGINDLAEFTVAAVPPVPIPATD